MNNSRLINNNCTNNDYGISLYYSNNNTISGNAANDNDYSGIYLEDYCNNNTISGNIANDSNRGIWLDSNCNNNTISENTANDSVRGICLYSACYDNKISGNTANNNIFLGIYLEDCDNSTISGNLVNDNGFAGILFDHCDNSTISGNILSDNNYYGMYIEPFCYYNIIYENFFLKNGIHALDAGTDNKWNSTTIGNYWDNWTSPDVSPNDGIVDYEYPYIGGTAGSIDYLPIAEDGAPSIIVNTPSEDDVFGTSAPSFSVTITDDFLDKRWYTLDGGLTIYAINTNATIDQTVWAALSEGSITITFYANDTLGHETSKDVIITKSWDDPTIVIVVVSIVGVVAVITVVYVFMKKRATPE